jgi:Rieske Fe-S protein
MSGSEDDGHGSETVGRRGFLVGSIAAIHSAIGGVVALVAGGATLAPSFTRREESWLVAAPVRGLPSNRPVAVTLRRTRLDGYVQVTDRMVVYLVRTGDEEVRALQSTCTHLGCRTSYDGESRRIVCPCHGGAFDERGEVVAGPPPAPLPALPTRVVEGRVLVQV